MKPFTDTLREIRRGKVVEAASEELAELIRAVNATGKSGSLTLKLDVRPQSKGDNAVIIKTKLSTNKPSADMPEAIFFADSDGDLHRDDPQQGQMFGEVELGDRPARERVNRETGEVLTA